jgi:hypothetical protein
MNGPMEIETLAVGLITNRVSNRARESMNGPGPKLRPVALPAPDWGIGVPAPEKKWSHDSDPLSMVPGQ